MAIGLDDTLEASIQRLAADARAASNSHHRSTASLATVSGSRPGTLPRHDRTYDSGSAGAERLAEKTKLPNFFEPT